MDNFIVITKIVRQSDHVHNIKTPEWQLIASSPLIHSLLYATN